MEVAEHFAEQAEAKRTLAAAAAVCVLRFDAVAVVVAKW